MANYKYKLQGDDRDSWEVTEDDGNRYMVYEDPNITPVPKVDVIGLLKSLSPEELNAIKQLLK